MFKIKFWVYIYQNEYFNQNWTRFNYDYRLSKWFQCRIFQILKFNYIYGSISLTIKIYIRM